MPSNGTQLFCFKNAEVVPSFSGSIGLMLDSLFGTNFGPNPIRRLSCEMEALGIDIGGVIISGQRDSLSGDYLQAPEIPGAIDAIGRLVRERFGRKVHLISKRGPRVQSKTLRWLKEHHFYERTDLKRRQIHFCMEREDKASICADLDITHFIDNRMDVLAYLRDIPYLFLFRPASIPDLSEVRWRNRIRRVTNWEEILDILLVKKSM